MRSFPRPVGFAPGGEGRTRPAAWHWDTLRELGAWREWKLREWCREVLHAMRRTTLERGPAQRALLASLRGDKQRLLQEYGAGQSAAREAAWAEVEAEAQQGGWSECRLEVAGERWGREGGLEAWRRDRDATALEAGGGEVVRVWNGTSGELAAARNLRAAAALAAWRRKAAARRLARYERVSQLARTTAQVCKTQGAGEDLTEEQRARAEASRQAAQQRLARRPKVEAEPVWLPEAGQAEPVLELLRKLASATGSPGLAWKSVAENADLLGISDAALRKELRELEQGGVIELSQGWTYVRLVAPKDEPAEPVAQAAGSAERVVMPRGAWRLVARYLQDKLASAGSSGLAERRLIGASLDRIKSLRGLCIMRGCGHQAEESEEQKEQRVTLGVPKGCQRIDEAMAVTPPEVGGALIRLSFAPRGPAVRRGTAARRAAAAVQARVRKRRRAVQDEMRAHNRWLKRRAAAPETQAAIWTWQARDRKRRWDINAEAAAEERRLKTPRSTAQEAAAEEEAERRSRTAEARAGAEALESGQRVEGARAARAGKRGMLASARARREAFHIRSPPHSGGRKPPGARGGSARARALQVASALNAADGPG